jgi:type II secretory pathway component PulJ
MKRTHALLIALALGIAVVAGAFAVIRTTQLGSKATATQVSSAQIARQNRALSRAEAALRAELRRKPPAIGALPARSSVPAQTVIYHRPPAVVHVIPRPGGEHEREAQGGDGNGGLDD